MVFINEETRTKFSIGSEESFKNANTFIQDAESNQNDVKKKGYLKRFATVPGAGVLLAALSSVCFATGVLTSKILEDEVNSNQVVVCRSAVQLFVYSIVIFWKKGNLFGVEGERWPLFLRGIFSFIGLNANYLAVQKMGWSINAPYYSDASAIIFSGPVFCVVLAFIILREPFKPRYFITLALITIGILLICKPEYFMEYHRIEEHSVQYIDRIIGTILALTACTSGSLAFIALRKLQKTQSQVSIVWFSVLSIFFGSILNAFFFEFRLPRTQFGWYILLLNGMCGVFGQLFLTLALKITAAGPISMTRTLDIVLAFVYQGTILHQEIEGHTIIGSILICIGVIITSVGELIFDKIKSLFVQNSSKAT